MQEQKVNLISISGKIGSGKDTVGKIIQWLTWGNNNLYTFEEFCDNYNKVDKYIGVPKFEIKKFADALKDMVCILIGCTREQLEDREFKEKELGEEWWYWETGNVFGKINYLNNKELYQSIPLAKLIKPTPRLLLQLIGTECGREIIHPNIWVNALFADYKPEVYYMCDRCEREDITHLIRIPSRFKEQGYDEDEWVCPHCKGEESEGDLTQVINDSPSNWVITDVRFPNEANAIRERGGIVLRVFRPGKLRVWFQDTKENRESDEHDFSGYYYVQSNVDGNWELTEFADGRGVSLSGYFDPKSFKFDASDSHPSETALDDYLFDELIINDGDIENLAEKVRQVLIKHKIL